MEAEAPVTAAGFASSPLPPASPLLTTGVSPPESEDTSSASGDSSDLGSGSEDSDAASWSDDAVADLEEEADQLAVADYDPPLEAKPVKASYTYFANCSAARAVGAAPVYSDDPGYSGTLDRDGDGIGCE